MIYRTWLSCRTCGLAAVTAGALILAACASQPKLIVERQRGVIDLGTVSTYSLSTSDQPMDAAVADSLRSALSRAGWREAPEASADWRLDVLYAVRPATTGAYVGVEPPTEEAPWLRPAAPHRWWRHDKQVRILVLSLVAPKTGIETARVSASLTARPDKPGASDEAAVVAELAIAALQTPDARVAP
nr:hypothetical protein [uncultured Brevundimonas sp.]